MSLAFASPNVVDSVMINGMSATVTGDVTNGFTASYKVLPTTLASSANVVITSHDASGVQIVSTVVNSVFSDVSAPAADTAFAAGGDTFINSGEVVASKAALTIGSGGTDTLTRVTVSQGNVSAVATLNPSTGKYEFNTAGFSQGNLNVTELRTDAAGNQTSSATTIRLDTVAPNAPTNLDLATADDTGVSNTDNITNQTTNLTISGTAEANAAVELFNGSVSLGKVTANSSGVFTTAFRWLMGANTRDSCCCSASNGSTNAAKLAAGCANKASSPARQAASCDRTAGSMWSAAISP